MNEANLHRQRLNNQKTPISRLPEQQAETEALKLRALQGL